MRLRRIGGLLLVPALLALAACTSSGKGGGSSHSAGASSGLPTDAARLSSLVQSAVSKLSSAAIKVGINLSAQELSGTGSEQLSGGDLSALDMTVQLGSAGQAQVIVAGGKTYAKLPAALNSSNKPWLLVTKTSSNTTIQQVAPLLDPVLSAVTPGTFGLLVAAAKSIDVKGSEPVGGVSATHYAMVVDVAKLPESFPGKADLAAGSDTVPFDLYLDSTGRPLRATPHLTVQGQDVPIDVEYSAFDKPVSISAPPAGQVGS